MFKIGDKVTWTSQSAGFQKTKVGEVVVILPQGERPGLGFLEKKELLKYSLKPIYCPGYSRDHESYLILVRTKLYWPRVKHLKLVEP